jgi:ABC-type transporter Mla subunit MlaD
MLEPKPQQRFVPELNDLLVQSHVLAAHIAAAAPLLRSMAEQEPDGSQALQRALSAVRENLARAQAGEPPPKDYAEATKQIKRELDAMVTEVERGGTQRAEFIGEIKLLALQCKQMLAASYLIRKDAGAIHLPEA